jgi:hypothetical protein
MENGRRTTHNRQMKRSDIFCPSCSAGYRRIEVASGKRTTGEYRLPALRPGH